MSYAYNGLGDRVSVTVDSVTRRHALDLNAGLTQVLADGANTYLYGLTRIGEQQPGGWAYHLPDALGSVRQLADASGAVTLAKGYEPYGSVLSTNGAGASAYGFTGEQQGQGGNTNLVFLRARYYSGSTGRFLSRDTWLGDSGRPMSYNPWLYSYANPVNWTDPSGLRAICSMLPPEDKVACENITSGRRPAGLPASTSGLGSAALPFCNPLLVRAGEPCIPISNCFPKDILHPLSVPRGNPHLDYGSNISRGYGEWFHYLLRNVPGWWNKNGLASETEILENLVALTLAAEFNEKQSGQIGGNMIYIAEAFARKAWNTEGQGFYGFIGGRQSLRSRLHNLVLFVAGSDGPDEDKEPDEWYWERSPDIRSKRLAAMVNTFTTVLPSNTNSRLWFAQQYSEKIVTTLDWHRKDENRPYDWGNIVEANPGWFKRWINVMAPVLSRGAPLPQQAGLAIWYRFPEIGNAPGANDTLYILTAAQQRELCGRFGTSNGCIGLTAAHEKPYFLSGIP